MASNDTDAEVIIEPPFTYKKYKTGKVTCTTKKCQLAYSERAHHAMKHTEKARGVIIRIDEEENINPGEEHRGAGHFAHLQGEDRHLRSLLGGRIIVRSGDEAEATINTKKTSKYHKHCYHPHEPQCKPKVVPPAAKASTKPKKSSSASPTETFGNIEDKGARKNHHNMDRNETAGPSGQSDDRRAGGSVTNNRIARYNILDIPAPTRGPRSPVGLNTECEEYVLRNGRKLMIPLGKKRLFDQMNLYQLSTTDCLGMGRWNHIPHIPYTDDPELIQLIIIEYVRNLVGDELFWLPPLCRIIGCKKRARAVGSCGHQSQCEDHPNAYCFICGAKMLLLSASETDIPSNPIADADAKRLENGFLKLVKIDLIVHNEQEMDAILSDSLDNISTESLSAIATTNNMILGTSSMSFETCVRLKISHIKRAHMPTLCRYCRTERRIFLHECRHDDGCYECTFANNSTCFVFGCQGRLDGGHIPIKN